MVEHSHYRQILVNLKVDDNIPEEELTNLKYKIEETIQKNKTEKIKEVRVSIN